MARVEFFMRIEPVDSENNLFRAQDIVSAELAEQICQTDWLNMPWFSSPDQTNLPFRRKIINQHIPWIEQWNAELSHLWPKLEQLLDIKMLSVPETSWWLDEPGFDCPLHTDGELPITMQLMWIGNKDLGTAFYWYKNFDSLRFRVEFKPNTGYIMRNLPDSSGYRKLLWHAMMEPIPENSFRLTSYTILYPMNI